MSFRVPLDYVGFERFHPDWTLNLSVNGIFVLTSKPLPVGLKLSLRFELPELSEPMEAVGHVAWSPGPQSKGAGKRHPQGMAVAFDRDDQEFQRTLDQYVTVSMALASIDSRIGNELPPHIRKELPVPEEPYEEILIHDPSS